MRIKEKTCGNIKKRKRCRKAIARWSVPRNANVAKMTATGAGTPAGGILISLLLDGYAGVKRFAGKVIAVNNPQGRLP
jgi:hypothetical protein